MNSRKVIITVTTLFCILGCKKPNDFKACFTTDRATYSVQEEIVFENCSSFNKGDENSGVSWSMGDGTAKFSFGNGSIVHEYAAAGNYLVKLRVGYKEGPADETERTITVE